MSTEDINQQQGSVSSAKRQKNNNSYLTTTTKQQVTSDSTPKEMGSDSKRVAEETLRALQKRFDAIHQLRSYLPSLENTREAFDNQKLDSNLKKTTGFIRKIKNLSEDQKDSICKDVRTLNLRKYVSEIIAALSELKFRTADIGAAVKICVLLHERYPEFGVGLQDSLLRQFASASSPYGLIEETVQMFDTANNVESNPQLLSERSLRMSKLKTLLRLMTELMLAGVFDSSTALQPVGEIFGRMLVADKKRLVFLSTIVYFVKRCGDYLMGAVPRSKLLQLEDFVGNERGMEDNEKGEHLPRGGGVGKKGFIVDGGKNASRVAGVLVGLHLDCVVPVEKQERMYSVCVSYYQKAAQSLKDELTKVIRSQRKSRYNIEMKGQLSPAETADYEKLVKAFEKLLVNVTSLGDCLDYDLPDVAFKLRNALNGKPDDELPSDLSREYWEYSTTQKGASGTSASTHSGEPTGIARLFDLDFGTDLSSTIDDDAQASNAGIDLVSYASGRGGIGIRNQVVVELDENSVWEDEETRRFYENLTPIDAVLPSVLFPSGQSAGESSGSAEKGESEENTVKTDETADNLVGKKETDEDKTGGSAEEVDRELAAAAASIEDLDEEGLDLPDDTEVLEDLQGDEDVDGSSRKDSQGSLGTSGGSGTKASSSTGAGSAELSVFMHKLSLCVNRELIDKLAVEFCYLNSKTNRQKLANFLYEIPKGRMEVIPYYSRLIATLNKCLPDIGATIVARLQKKFLYLIKSKDQSNLESKMKIMRYIGELTKFNIFPKHNCLNVVYKLLSDFSYHNIDMLCCLLETCGRYLYRTQVSHARTRVLLETMMKKKSALHLDGRQQAMVENAFYYSNPPERSKIERVEAPPLHMFICLLVYKELNMENVVGIYKLLCKLDWKDPFVFDFCCRALTGVWNVNYDNVCALASLLRWFSKLHDDLCVIVIDNLLEEIRLGLENNYVKWNQRRLSVVKYLGELHNCGMIELRVIMDTLYGIMCFGRSPMEECEGYSPPKDRADDYFRIVLICTLLDSVYENIDMGKKGNGKKIECFLTYFF